MFCKVLDGHQAFFVVETLGKGRAFFSSHTQGISNARIWPYSQYLPFTSLLQGAKKRGRLGVGGLREWKPANGMECTDTRAGQNLAASSVFYQSI